MRLVLVLNMLSSLNKDIIIIIIIIIIIGDAFQHWKDNAVRPTFFAVTAKLISAFVFATRIIQFIYFLNPKFQASSHLLWSYSLVCVGPGRKSRRPVFSQRG